MKSIFILMLTGCIALTASAGPRIALQELGTSATTLSIQPSTEDGLNGNIATMVSPTPWHPANTNPADHEEAFTDGQGLGALAGLLNDCLKGCGTINNQNVPAAVAQWYFDPPQNLAELRVFSGNRGRDGRIFHHYDVTVTSDPDPTNVYFEAPLLEEVTPVPGINPGEGGFGLIGNPNNPGTYEASLSVVNDDANGPLARSITGLQIAFYQVSNTAGAFRDDWDPGCEGFDPENCDDRDGAQAGFESPLIYEVDLFFGDAPITNPTSVPDWALY